MPYFIVPLSAAALAARTFPAIARVLGGGTQVIQRTGDRLALWVPQTLPIMGRVLTGGSLVTFVQRVLVGAGFVAGSIAVSNTLSDILPSPADVGIGSIAGGGGGGNQTHPSQVLKEWTANGVAMVSLADGRMGAYSKTKNSWKYWRPKKPIVMYAGGSSDLRTLLKADKAAEKQLRTLKKAIDRRFPSRRSTRPQVVVQEAGQGGVQVARR